ncbi:MAG TPA: hypothetical protein EYG34_08940 [Acidimicrobiia bacterium]|jgi:hypothetical protein|nr:hypothetical protein [Acidimicrobiia bacterium]HIL47219.1 hypothetical protein [Acidimicrobiia bacterium]
MNPLNKLLLWAFLFALVSSCSNNTDSPSVVAVLSEIPAEISQSVALLLPQDLPENENPVALDLYQITSAATVEGQELPLGVFAVLQTPSNTGQTAVEATDLGAVGPAGLQGYGGLSLNNMRIVVVSRDLSTDQRQAIYRNLGSVAEHPSIQLLTSLADSPVPGIGSAQVPNQTDGFVISYVSAPSQDQDWQKSVVVARFEGNAQHMQILQWWFDGASDPLVTEPSIRFTASLPALFTNEELTVPTATLNVWLESDIVTIVRVVGVDLATDPDGWPKLKAPDQKEWEELLLLRPNL